MDFAELVVNLLIVLIAGLAAGIACKRMGISVLVGYLLVGAMIGRGGLGLLTDETHDLHHLAEAGALLLLFSIGIEFSLRELVELSRYFFLGGITQMTLAALPVIGLSLAWGIAWQPAVLMGAAAALSSTVLVFKTLEEYGQASAPHGRRAVGILLFQDVALVPLMLLVPFLVGDDQRTSFSDWVLLGARSTMFVIGIIACRELIARWAVPLLARLRGTELVVLFSLTVLGGASYVAYRIGLPPALGAFAAGLMLSDNRLTGQIDALVLPYRETFAALFFVALGSLMEFDVLVDRPAFCLGALAVVLALKTGAAAVALKLLGLQWKVAGGMGLGLAQMGELSFMLLSAGVAGGVVSADQYNLTLFLALGTLILTPQLLRTGLRWADTSSDTFVDHEPVEIADEFLERALVVGLGPIGSQVASQLELQGIDVCLIDLSPVNLHPYAQQGFHTISGDASDPAVLQRAELGRCRLVVITSPEDRIAKQVVRAIRKLNRSCTIMVRCRYQANAPDVKKAGADVVISEEVEVSAALLRQLPKLRTP